MTVQPSNLTQMEAQLRSLSFDTPTLDAPAFDGNDTVRRPRPWRWAAAMTVALTAVAAGVYYSPLRETLLSAWDGAALPITVQPASAAQESAALATAGAVTRAPSTPAVVSRQIIGSGYSRAESDVILGAPIAGRIASVKIVEGALVAADQPLIQMQDRSAREAVQAAEVQVRQNEFSQTAAELTLDELQTTQARLEKLVASGASTARAAEDNAYLVKAAELAVEQSRLAVASARDALDAAQADLSDHVLRAPFSGQIATLQASTGMMTNGDADDALVRMFDPQSIVVDVDIAERNLEDLSLGLETTVVFDAWPSQEFAGAVSSIAPILTKERGTLRVTIALKEIPAQLRPNMAARATLILADQSQATAQKK